jgi:Malectin domain
LLHWNDNAGRAQVVNQAERRNSGGPAVNWFAADANFSGGNTASTTATIVTTGVSDPAPMAAYQTERWGAFTYTIAGLTANTSHTVRLHFAEVYWNAANQRKFHVNINGTRVLTDFDVYAAAGGKNKAHVRQFTATSNSSGQITVQYLQGSVDWPKSSGIEVIRP